MHAFVKKGLLLSAATGALVLGGAAAASAATSATADGLTADSPGALSGNTVQVPADVPIQVCGVTVAAVAAATSADDNTCIDDGTSAAAAHGTATGSPGVLSGNVLQVVLNAPIQACGDAVGVAAYGTRADGNTCVVGGHGHPMGPPPMGPPPCPPPVTEPCPPGTWSW